MRALFFASLLLLSGCRNHEQVKVAVHNRSSQTVQHVTVSHQGARRTIEGLPIGQSVRVTLPLQSEAGLELVVRFEDGRQLRTSGYVEPGYHLQLEVQDTELTLKTKEK